MIEDAGSERQADDAGLRAGYERLREAVLSGRPDGFRLGHGVLAAHGMIAWMDAFGALGPGEVPELLTAGQCPPATSSRSYTAGSLPSADQVVAVLSQMALAHAA